ncbi:uncharacterized protein [Montipora capricornis]|uniref:uncharacterized protein n=1 Tax=Montipora capricornis TaxID=246305 RepID=UPI0035F18681
MTTGYIIDSEVLDKREVELKSVNMEKKALEIILQRIKHVLNVVEVVTDASASIKKMMDWQFKGSAENKSVVRSHYQPLLDQWIGLLHHVCNDHDWPGGNCDHGDLPEDRSLPWFDRRAKDFEALQQIILDPALLESFKFYIKFRHTGPLECANSMALMYTSKKVSFTKTVYRARRKLTAIDWNYHNDLPFATSEDAETIITRKYNQRTKSWDVRKLKVAKDYGYMWILVAKIFKLRSDDDDAVTREVPMEPDDPRLIALTIAECEPLPPHELLARRKSRFSQTSSS